MIPRSAVINFSASGDNTVIAAPASGSIKVLAVVFTVGGATNIIFKDNAGNSFSGAEVFTGNGSSKTLPAVPDWVWYFCQPGREFRMNSSSAVAVTGTIWYML